MSIHKEFDRATESFRVKNPHALEQIVASAKSRARRSRIAVIGVVLVLMSGVIALPLATSDSRSQPPSAGTQSFEAMAFGPYFGTGNAADLRGSETSLFAWGADQNVEWKLLKLDPLSGSVVASAPAPFAGREGGNPIATTGSQVIVGGAGTPQLGPGGSIRIYDADSLDLIRAIPVSGSSVTALSVDPTGEILASVHNQEGLETLVAIDPLTGNVDTLAAIRGQTQTLVQTLVATEDAVLVSYLTFSSNNVLEGQHVELVDRRSGAVHDLRPPAMRLLGLDAQEQEVVAISSSSPWELLLLSPVTGELDRTVTPADSAGSEAFAAALSGDEVVIAVADGTGGGAQPTILRVNLATGETSPVELDTSQAILALTTFSDGRVAALTEKGRIVTSGN